MKKFPDFSKGSYSEMPENPEPGGHSCPKAPFPEAEACHRGEIISDPQISPAQAEGGPDPCRQQQKAQQQLRQPGDAAVEGPQKIHSGTQHYPGEKAPQEPGQEDRRGHDRQRRLGRGSP